MSKNRIFDVTIRSNNAETIAAGSKRRTLSTGRRLNPWHLFGWVRKKLKSTPNRDFYSQSEKEKHHHAKMAQRVANHHHGFKF